MNRYVIAVLTLLLVAYFPIASGAPKVVDEQQVFAYSAAVAAGDRVAVRKVFALNTDGASAEDQDIVLGSLIAQHPRLFLEELQRSQFAHCKHCLDGLLGNLGDDYVDRPEAQIGQLKERRDALRSVHDNSLMKLRNECITNLTVQIQTILGIIGANAN